MFDSVLDRGVAPRRRLATGAVVSVFGHTAVLTLALLVRPPAAVEEVADAFPTVIIPTFRPAAAPGPRGGGGAPAHAGPARASHPRRELPAPAAIRKSVDLETFSPPDETEGGRIGPVDPSPGIDPPGDGKGGGGEGEGEGEGSCYNGRCDIEGMTPPFLLERGREPDYTLEALEAHVQGLMTIQCVLTLEGRLQQCRVIRPQPYMDRAVVEALMTRRYTPATLHGRALAVRYTVQVKLVMPR